MWEQFRALQNERSSSSLIFEPPGSEGREFGGQGGFVGAEEDQGVVEEAELLEETGHLAHGIVHGGEHGGVQAALGVEVGEALDVPARRVHGVVRSVEGEIEEEGPRAVLGECPERWRGGSGNSYPPGGSLPCRRGHVGLDGEGGSGIHWF